MTGLSSVEARRRLEEFGPNQLAREKATPAWRVFLGQFKGALIWLLTGACGVSLAVGEWIDALAIGAILILNAIVGFVQEYRAERSILALRNMTAPHARVVRDGTLVDVSAADVVPGDVLALEAGDVVAADAVLIDAHDLCTSEAALTGESAPVEKSLAPLGEEVPLAERANWVFMGTSVANGTARAEVRATGMRTELGKIAHLLASTEAEPTPLQRQLEKVGRRLLLLCAALVILFAGLAAARGGAPLEVLRLAVSLAVAAVPEGLAAIVTIALAIGVQRMADRHVLVRRLPAVETLGSTTVICTDKTGTLTTGVMTVREVWGEDHQKVIEAAALNCDAALDAEGSTGVGDPTEVAILRAAVERGVDVKALEHSRARTNAHPFDSRRKRMSTLRSDGVLYVKGAVEAMLAIARDGTNAEAVRRANEEMASDGLRVLAVGVGRRDEERDVELMGLLGIADPPRTEALEAVAAARAAGISVVMITGDHPVTAEAIGREMGIIRPGEEPAALVHARAAPEDKLRVVRQWKGKGAIVAMTGDGVNDAPALKEAHIGIAMGKTGTEVTREASDMVLTDDNFASIVSAVREGRGIFDNIRRALVYLVAGNVGELMLMIGAGVLGMPMPLLPMHLLWINLVTDGLPALTLVMEPPVPDILKRPPRRPDAPILGRNEWLIILAVGLLLSALTLTVFAWALKDRSEHDARSLVFSVLVFSLTLRAFAFRNEKLLLWEVGPFSNFKLLGVVGVTVLVQLALHHMPVTQRLFGIGPIGLRGCMLALGLGLIPVSLMECAKLLWRLRPMARRAEAPA